MGTEPVKNRQYKVAESNHYFGTAIGKCEKVAGEFVILRDVRYHDRLITVTKSEIEEYRPSFNSSQIHEFLLSLMRVEPDMETRVRLCELEIDYEKGLISDLQLICNACYTLEQAITPLIKVEKDPTSGQMRDISRTSPG